MASKKGDLAKIPIPPHLGSSTNMHDMSTPVSANSFEFQMSNDMNAHNPENPSDNNKKRSREKPWNVRPSRDGKSIQSWEIRMPF